MYAFKWEKADIGYGRKVILNNVNLTIPRGCFTLLSGDNGSGKTTLVKTVEEKRLLLRGKLLVAEELLANSSFIAQNNAIRTYFPLSVFDTVAMGLYARSGYIKTLFKVDEKRVDAMLERLGLLQKRSLLLRECSGGELKKTLLGRSLIKNPDLLILDEPFANVDQPSCKTIVDLILEHNRSRQMTVLVISHHRELLTAHAAKIVELQGGDVYEV